MINLLLSIAQAETLTVTGPLPMGIIGTNAFYWVAIMFFVITLAAVCCLCTMADDKSNDTILYAKFISNIKEK